MGRKIHLIEKRNLIKPIGNNVYESKYWDVSIQQADELIGGDIYFHRKQKEPSFYGGKIIGYRIHEEEGEFKGRIIFHFEYSHSHRGVLAGNGGWSYEKKIV
jgi:hypothetical protein